MKVELQINNSVSAKARFLTWGAISVQNPCNRSSGRDHADRQRENKRPFVPGGRRCSFSDWHIRSLLGECHRAGSDQWSIGAVLRRGQVRVAKLEVTETSLSKRATAPLWLAPLR